jgi:hypothetical protein
MHQFSFKLLQIFMLNIFLVTSSITSIVNQVRSTSGSSLFQLPAFDKKPATNSTISTWRSQTLVMQTTMRRMKKILRESTWRTESQNWSKTWTLDSPLTTTPSTPCSSESRCCATKIADRTNFLPVCSKQTDPEICRTLEGARSNPSWLGQS